ncbi:type III polyketide synthase [uncultured Pseudokineococcus sp.]|uniref:type III polyketide synthase n=1 Tax=uncultured Pseudokineococcus sp. TaxID=1642928 RepID=UPI0026154ABB|nr:3-oxoacyl-[acyl-carrier-protein] synthase III C-terminal domain-containing protein [uncultured Pseudokineococcus sp.]
MSRIVSVGRAVPARTSAQADITDAFSQVMASGGELDGTRRQLLHRLHGNTGVRTRHLALPLEEYPQLDGFRDANDAYLRVGLELGERAVRDALGQVGLTPQDVDVIVFASTTGVAAPSLDARLVEPLGLRADVKRMPLFGLGCVAGAAGVARVHDHLRGDPDGVAVLLAVELCSLTVQRDDTSTANLVASGLFGDGAAAVVVLGDRRAAELGLPGPDVVGASSRFYPDTADVMGWDVGGSGFRIVLTTSVTDVVQQYLADDVTGFLDGHELRSGDVARWVAHPGGPKVLEAVTEVLELPEGALARSWADLAENGNMSSVSVLHVLAQTLAEPPADGDHALMFAMGPGFCAELVLLRWPDAQGAAGVGGGPAREAAAA